MGNYKLNIHTGRLDLTADSSFLKLKGVKDTTADLPLTGNTENDCWIVKADDRIYTWNKSTPDGILSDWIDIGSVTSIDWSIITNKPSSTVVDIDDAVTKKHTQNTDEYLEPSIVTMLYVDAHRTDSYTPNGTKYQPYKTYYDAISSILDNSQTKRYIIKILGKTTEPDSDLPIKNCVFVEGYQMQGSVIKVQPGRSLIWDAQDGSGQENGYSGFKDLTISRTDYSTTDLIKVLRTTVTPADNWCIFELSGCNIRGDVKFYGKGMGRDYFQVYNTVFLAGNLDIKNAYVLYHGVSTWGNSYITVDNPTYDYYGYGSYYITESCQFYGTTIAKTVSTDGLYVSCASSLLQGATTIEKFAGSTLYADFDAVSYPNTLTLTGNPTLSRLTEGEAIKNDSSVTGDTVKDALDNLIEKNGINGTFTTTDGKTITVVDGQITNIT